MIGVASPSPTLPANINIAHARLPQTYEAAKAALSNCASLDECQDWADRAAALASYARMADDDALEKLSTRIRTRAIRRAGELLKQIEPARGANQNIGGDASPKVQTRKDAAADAGLSPDQAKQAIRVANVPAEDFEKQVESPNPPTVTALAEQGKKPLTMPVRPAGFQAATSLIGTVERFAQFCAAETPETVAEAVMPHEAADLRVYVATIDGWLDRFVVNLKG